ncbi:MAG: hypothetical protein AAF639_37250 [Chloroflexota bacterium]
MTKQTIKLIADYDCWPLWWSGDDKIGNINPNTLPLSGEAIERLTAWSETFDAQLK